MSRLLRFSVMVFLIVSAFVLITGCAAVEEVVEEEIDEITEEEITEEVEEADETVGEEMTLTYASALPQGHIMNKAADYFMEEIEERTGGRIQFERFYGGTIMGPEENLDVVSDGVADLATSAWVWSPGRTPLGNFDFQLWFNDPSVETQAKIKREMFETIPALSEELAQFNVAPPLLFHTLPDYVFISKTPIYRLEDFAGLRLGATAVEYGPIAEAAGMSLINRPGPEFYEILDRGVVDVINTSILLHHANMLHEIASYLIDVNVATTASLSLWMNMGTWDSLSAEDQNLFKEVGINAEQKYHVFLADHLERVNNDFEEAGLEVISLPQEDVEEWANRMPDIGAIWAEEMESRGLPGWEIVDTYIELYEREGWTWPRRWGER